MGFFDRRAIKKYLKEADKVIAYEKTMAALSDDELRAKTDYFKEQLENGKTLESYKADVDSDEKFEKDTEVVKDGVFEESKYRSAPYFDVEIDGITLLDRNYGD